MADNEKPEKKSKKLYDRDKAHIVTDIMICFIGICMILIAFLSLTGKVPKEYAFGATLAGFCFVYADVFIIEEELSLKDLLTYGISIFLGVLSFILLPVILLIYSKLGEVLMSDSDFYTFLAFGIVLMTMGYKTLVRRQEQRTKISSELEEIQGELNTMKGELNEMSRLVERTEKDLAKAQLLVSGLTIDDK